MPAFSGKAQAKHDACRETASRKLAATGSTAFVPHYAPRKRGLRFEMTTTGEAWLSAPEERDCLPPISSRSFSVSFIPSPRAVCYDMRFWRTSPAMTLQNLVCRTPLTRARRSVLFIFSDPEFACHENIRHLTTRMHGAPVRFSGRATTHVS